MEEVISEYLEGAEFGGKQVDKNMDTIDWLDQGKDHKPSRSDVTIFHQRRPRVQCGDSRCRQSGDGFPP
jgi:hypothetical protein